MGSDEPDQFKKFDSAMTKIMAVSHDELKRREAEWKKQRRQAKKRRQSKSAA